MRPNKKKAPIVAPSVVIEMLEKGIDLRMAPNRVLKFNPFKEALKKWR